MTTFCTSGSIKLTLTLQIAVLLLLLFGPPAQSMKIELSKKTATTEYHTASNVARKATAFLFEERLDSRWNRNTVSLVSSVTGCSDTSVDFLDQVYG